MPDYGWPSQVGQTDNQRRERSSTYGVVREAHSLASASEACFLTAAHRRCGYRVTLAACRGDTTNIGVRPFVCARPRTQSFSNFLRSPWSGRFVIDTSVYQLDRTGTDSRSFRVVGLVPTRRLTLAERMIVTVIYSLEKRPKSPSSKYDTTG